MFTLWKKRPFFWGRGQFAVYFGKFNRRLVTNGDGQMSPLSIPPLLHFLRRDLQFANICSSVLFAMKPMYDPDLNSWGKTIWNWTLFIQIIFLQQIWTCLEIVINTNLDWFLESITETDCFKRVFEQYQVQLSLFNRI